MRLSPPELELRFQLPSVGSGGGRSISEPIGEVSVLTYSWFRCRMTSTAFHQSVQVMWFARKFLILHVIRI